MSTTDLRRGDTVVVRSAAEILATLDDRGTLDGLPFMPEMVAYCGRRFTVDGRAAKLCDTITNDLRSRHLPDAVYLEERRCDGSEHGGCEAECRLYWKEAWLRRVDPEAPTSETPASDSATDELLSLLRQNSVESDATPVRFICQATQFKEATSPLSTANIGSYVAECTSGNVRPAHFVRVMSRAVAMQTLFHFDRLPSPPLKGPSPKSPPTPEPLDLQPGEWVRVKSKEEIQQTLTDKGANRGLWFDREMMEFCGKTFQVRRRVSQIVDERTGEMIDLTKNPCISLEGGVCSGEFSTGRWFCPRKIFSYFRECWLERVEGPPHASGPGPVQ